MVNSLNELTWLKNSKLKDMQSKFIEEKKFQDQGLNYNLMNVFVLDQTGLPRYSVDKM